MQSCEKNFQNLSSFEHHVFYGLKFAAARQRNAGEIEDEYYTDGHDANNLKLLEVMCYPGTNAGAHEPE